MTRATSSGRGSDRLGLPSMPILSAPRPAPRTTETHGVADLDPGEPFAVSRAAGGHHPGTAAFDDPTAGQHDHVLGMVGRGRDRDQHRQAERVQVICQLRPLIIFMGVVAAAFPPDGAGGLDRPASTTSITGCGQRPLPVGNSLVDLLPGWAICS